MKTELTNRAHGSQAGFSLVEVLVTVAIVGSALTVLLGTLRAQVHSLRELRSHSEARLLLEQAVNRYQYGDGAESDSLIVGMHGEYALSFEDVAGPADIIGDRRFLCRRVVVQWSTDDKSSGISIDAWRFEPEEKD